MTPMSHYVATEIVSRALGLSGWHLVLAYIFGVFIDIDHFFVKRVWKNLRTLIDPDINNRTFLQEPVFILVLGAIGIFFNNYIPAIFLSIHWIMDAAFESERRPLAPFSEKWTFRGLIKSHTRTEYVVSIFLAVILLVWRLITGFGFK